MDFYHTDGQQVVFLCVTCLGALDNACEFCEHENVVCETFDISLQDNDDDDQNDTKHATLLHGIFVAFERVSSVATSVYHSDLPHSIYTSVRGVQMYGLLVDPGASKGLMGTDTLHDIIKFVLKPCGLENAVVFNKSTSSFTGISDSQQHSLGIVNFPIGLLMIARATYTADVVGSNGSLCPGLVPLRSFIASHCLIACNYFNNGDGVLAIRAKAHDGVTRYCPQRLLLTDSGHYMLQIHHFNKRKSPLGLSQRSRQAQTSLRSSINQFPPGLYDDLMKSRSDCVLVASETVEQTEEITYFL